MELKTTCEQANVRKQGSNAMFVIEAEAIPPEQPGQPARRTARTVIQFNFNDNSAKQFDPGKGYSITINELVEA